MKNFKKVLSFALALLMVVGCLVAVPVDAKADTTYTKVTSVSEITAGGKFVLVATNGTNYYALGTTISGKVTGKEVAVTNNALSGSDIPAWTIALADSTNIVTLSNGSAFLAYNSSTNFKSVTDATTDKAEQWTVSEEGDGFKFVNVKSDTRGIAYQVTSTDFRFGPYSTTNLTSDDYDFGLMVFKVNESEGGGSSEEESDEPEDITLPADATPEQIVNAAYEARDNSVALLGTWSLTGVITQMVDKYEGGTDYQNVTVDIQIGDMTDKLIQGYRVVVSDTLTLDDLQNLATGDTITIKGELSYYNSKVQFKLGSTIEAITKAETPKENITLAADATPEQIVNAAYEARDNGVALLGTWSLTGVITTIKDAYEGGSDYKNVDVTIQVGDITDKLMRCYRVVASDAVTLDDLQALAVGDTITVTGTISYYYESVQFVAGSTIDSIVKAEVDGDTEDTEDTESDSESGSETEKESESEEATLTPAEIMALAEALKEGESLEGEYTLTGKVLEVSEVSSYGDVNVTLEVDGTDGKTIYCYGVKGDGNTEIKVGDKITVTGSIKNYKNTVEFYLPQFIPAKGDLSSMAVYMILFAGVALVAVAFVGKRKMA